MLKDIMPSSSPNVIGEIEYAEEKAVIIFKNEYEKLLQGYKHLLISNNILQKRLTELEKRSIELEIQNEELKEAQGNNKS